MNTSINALIVLIILWAVVAVVFIVMGLIQRQRRTLFFLSASMFGFISALMATVSYFILQALPH